MKVLLEPFDGVKVLEPTRFADSRGFFLESFHQGNYGALGIQEAFVQDNHSRSVRNVLRGLHFTRKKAQSQILTVIRGRIFDVVVDLRRGSPSSGKWFGAELSDEGPRQIYMAHGFAHGFCVLSEIADLHYKVSQFYDPADEGGLRWDDPTVAIKWPVSAPIISPRDLAHPRLDESLVTG